jgi:hypothetical protein
VALGVDEGVLVPLAELDCVALELGLAEGVAEADGDDVLVSVTLLVSELVGVTEVVGADVIVRVELRVEEGVAMGLREGVKELETVGSGVREPLPLAV